METVRMRSLVLEEETVFVACVGGMAVETQGTTKIAQEKRAFVLEASDIVAAEVAPWLSICSFPPTL